MRSWFILKEKKGLTRDDFESLSHRDLIDD